jgi:hypothetical protein
VLLVAGIVQIYCAEVEQDVDIPSIEVVLILFLCLVQSLNRSFG